MIFSSSISLPIVVTQLHLFLYFQIADVWNLSLLLCPFLNSRLPTLTETFFFFRVIAQIINFLYSLSKKCHLLVD